MVCSRCLTVGDVAEAMISSRWLARGGGSCGVNALKWCDVARELRQGAVEQLNCVAICTRRKTTRINWWSSHDPYRNASVVISIWLCGIYNRWCAVTYSRLCYGSSLSLTRSRRHRPEHFFRGTYKDQGQRGPISNYKKKKWISEKKKATRQQSRGSTPWCVGGRVWSALYQVRIKRRGVKSHASLLQSLPKLLHAIQI